MVLLAAPSLARLLGDWRLATARGPSYLRLAAAVRSLVDDGRLPVGSRLPAERELAAALGLSRTTVTAAYAALRESRTVVARQGAGTFVAGTRVAGGGVPVSAPAPGTVADLAVASPEADAASLLPAVARATAALPAHLGGHGYDVLGLGRLRDVVAARYAARGVPTSPDQVLVTAGSLGGLGLAVRAVVTPGDRVLVDVPTYPNALDAVRRAGGRLVGVPLHDHGWDLDAVAAAYRQAGPRLAYLVADHANPTGHRLDAAGRAAVVAAAGRAGTTLLVDETLADLVLDGEPAPPVAAWDEDGRVVTVGSLSKSHWGGLRIGWVRAPRALVARLADARGAVDLAPPVLEQLVAAELLEDATAVPARVAQVRDRRDVLVAALADRLPAWEVRVPEGGLSLWARLDAPVATALAAAAARHGVRLVPGGRFTVDGTAERRVRLPFSLPPEQLREAVTRLAVASAEVVGEAAGAGAGGRGGREDAPRPVAVA